MGRREREGGRGRDGAGWREEQCNGIVTRVATPQSCQQQQQQHESPDVLMKVLRLCAPAPRRDTDTEARLTPLLRHPLARVPRQGCRDAKDSPRQLEPVIQIVYGDAHDSAARLACAPA